MKQFVLLTAFALCIGACILAVGCSSDNAVNSPLPPGDVNDPDFQFVEDQVFGDQFTGGLDLSMELSTVLLDSIPGAVLSRNAFSRSAHAAAMGDLVFESLSYNYSGGWHIFTCAGYFGTTFPTDTVDFSGIDSVRTLSMGSPQSTPDSTTDEIEFRAHLSAASRSGSFTRDGDHSLDMKLVIEPTMNISLNGQSDEALTFVYEDTAATCDVNVSTSLTVSNVTIDFSSNACPSSGSMSAAASLSMACVGSLTLSADGTWHASAIFNGDTMTMYLNDGTNSWTVVDSCGTGPVALGLNW